jgi:hypothetical protein
MDCPLRLKIAKAEREQFLTENLNNEREPNFRRVFGAPKLTARAGICV